MTGGATRVLLVDSNEEDEELIRGELSLSDRCDFAVEVAHSLEAAEQHLESGGVDVVILDLVLPDCQGITTFLHLHPKVGSVPIIVLVDQADEELGIKSVDKGALDYLVKQQVVYNLLVRTLRYASERTHTLLALKASERKYRELFENVNVGVFQTSQDGRFISANPALIRLLGYRTEDELLALDIAEDLYMYPEDRANWLRAIDQDGEIRGAEILLKRKDGRKLVVLENARVISDEAGRPLYYEGTVSDITEAHEISKQLSYDASHDALTGLINRREFELRLERALDSAQAQGATHAVCYLDLDQFKVINDSCGHVAGDELLRQLGQTLQTRLRQGDTLARLGGDEFGILLQHCSLENAFQIAREQLVAIQNFQFFWSNNTFSVGVSIGLVPIDNSFRRLTEVLGAADVACYAAKDQGRNRIHVYKEDDSVTAKRHGEKLWVTRVKHALNEDRFFLDVQHIAPINKKEGESGLYEVLVRMVDENGRMVPPGAFLPAVERYNLATRLDHWVVNAVFTWMDDHEEQLNHITRFFINLSADSLADPDFASIVAEGIRERGVPARKVCFDITESAAVANLSRANQLIKNLRQLGCKFALDDFGSGLSSFAYLKALPVDYLKIDGLYVRDVADDPIAHEIVSSINEIGHVMGKETIAEAVENERVLEKLKKIGIDFAQGFELGRPRPIDDLASANFQILEGDVAI